MHTLSIQVQFSILGVLRLQGDLGFERISRSLCISNCAAGILQMGHHHFVLIHGGCHGAWAWWKTVDRLQRAGCRTTALDLTSAGNDTTDPNSVTSFAQYNKPAVDFIVSLPDDEKVWCLQ